MGAEVSGRRLLGEVEEARLDEVLHSVRLSAQPGLSETRFGIPPLDRLLCLFEQPRPRHHDPPSPPLDQPQRHRATTTKPPLVELTSAGPGAGKTQLLYLITTLAILPRTYAGIDLQGKSSAVVIVDTDGHFSVTRLATVAKGHITRCSRRAQQQQHRHTTIDPAAADALIAAALTHVHILQPQSQAALIAALRALPAYLFPRTTGTGTTTTHHHSTHRPLHSILVDSASAFFWPLRAADDDAQLLVSNGDGDGGGGGGARATSTSTSTTTSESYTTLARTLVALSAQLNCAVVATTTTTPLLPPSWHAAFAPSLRLAVGRAAVRPFAPAMSVAEASAERGQRQGVVERGRCGVRVEGYYGGGGGSGEQQAYWGAREAWEGGLAGLEGWMVDVRGDGVVVVEGGEGDGEGEEI